MSDSTHWDRLIAIKEDKTMDQSSNRQSRLFPPQEGQDDKNRAFETFEQALFSDDEEALLKWAIQEAGVTEEDLNFNPLADKE